MIKCKNVTSVEVLDEIVKPMCRKTRNAYIIRTLLIIAAVFLGTPIRRNPEIVVPIMLIFVILIVSLTIYQIRKSYRKTSQTIFDRMHTLHHVTRLERDVVISGENIWMIVGNVQDVNVDSLNPELALHMSDIDKIIETETQLLLHFKGNSYIWLDKFSFENGTIDDVRTLISKYMKK